MEPENHALLHELAASLKYIDQTLNEIKTELRDFREFQLRVEKYIMAEETRKTESSKYAKKISFLISSIVSMAATIFNTFIRFFT